MQSQIQSISPVLFEVKVEVPWEQLAGDLEARFDKVARSARIRGFRPGKAPRKLVRQIYGSRVRDESVAGWIERSLLAAVQEHQLQLVSRPQVQPADILEGEPLQIVAQLEVRPRIERVDTDSLSVDVPPIAVAAAAIDAEIERLRQVHADVSIPEPMRPARLGDQLIVSYQTFIDGQLDERASAKESTLTLGQDGLLPELEQALLGATPSEQPIAVEVDFAVDHANERLRGKKVRFEVTVQRLNEILLPQVDDEFAKDCGDFEDLAALRADAEQRLHQRAEHERRRTVQERLFDALLVANDVAVPPSLLEQQRQQLVMDHYLMMRWLGQPPAPLTDELIASLEQRAERQVRLGLLLNALALQEKIEISAAELEARITSLASESGKHPAKLRVEYQGEKLEALRWQLLEEKLVELLRSRATLVEKA